jgi:inosine/xanthosine triphosphatase
MTTLIVASSNPVKIAAALAGFQRMFPGENFTARGISAPSGVRDQPHGDAETRLGAANRAAAVRRLAPHGDYWIGIEGGVIDQDGIMQVFAWVVILSDQRAGAARTGAARTAMYVLPEEVARLVRTGLELGDADDAVFGRANSKQDDGSVGILTSGTLDRREYYAHAVVLALIPFKQPLLTFPSFPMPQG